MVPSSKFRDHYSVSFLARGLLLQECVAVTQVYQEHPDWVMTRQIVLDLNLLQVRAEATASRIFREVRKRLQAFSEEEFCYFTTASSLEQRQLLWIACCRTYRFIADFALEVIRIKMMSLEDKVTKSDCRRFYNEKSLVENTLNELTEASRGKLERTLVLMMKEARIISKEGGIEPVFVSSDFARLIAKKNAVDLLFLPTYEADIKELLK